MHKVENSRAYHSWVCEFLVQIDQFIYKQMLPGDLGGLPISRYVCKEHCPVVSDVNVQKPIHKVGVGRWWVWCIASFHAEHPHPFYLLLGLWLNRKSCTVKKCTRTQKIYQRRISVIWIYTWPSTITHTHTHTHTYTVCANFLSKTLLEAFAEPKPADLTGVLM